MTFRSPYHNHDPTISEALSQEGNTSDVGIRPIFIGFSLFTAWSAMRNTILKLSAGDDFQEVIKLIQTPAYLDYARLCHRCVSQLAELICFFVEDGSGGGTRTPDTRIMIPLL